MTTNHIVPSEQDAPGQLRRIEPLGNIDPMALVQHAIDSKVDPANMERIVALVERVQANVAKSSFQRALTAFKSECPPVPRKTTNSQFSVERDGVKVKRKYASLDDIQATIRDPLGKHGLSYRWTNAVNAASADGKSQVVKLECVIMHEAGHSESSPVEVQITSNAGCSEQQKYGAATTYAMRYSLVQALGLTSCDEDDDGNEDGGGAKITQAQADHLDVMIRDNNLDRGRFLTLMGVGSLADIPASSFNIAESTLKAKAGKGGK